MENIEKIRKEFDELNKNSKITTKLVYYKKYSAWLENRYVENGNILLEVLKNIKNELKDLKNSVDNLTKSD